MTTGSNRCLPVVYGLSLHRPHWPTTCLMSLATDNNSANPAVRITSLFGQQTAGYLPRSKQKRGTAAFISNKLCFDRKTK
ncbi:MAG: hypothetical protein F9K30_02555 [Dechloromonas sp.]|nr:MAG: hypothetical protein F9K30_02555 [Dechloromonas sp.]